MKTDRLNRVFAVIVVLAFALGCGKKSESDSTRTAPPNVKTERAPQKTAKKRTDLRRPLLAQSNKLADQKEGKKPDAKPKKKATTEEKDYWSKVTFGREEFEHMRRYVQRNYYHPYIDEKMAYVSAANYALLSVKPAYEIYPNEFLRSRRKHPDEEGRLSGKVFKLKPSDRFSIIVYTKAKKKKKAGKKNKRLTDEEILKLRAKFRARNKLLKREWAKVPFGEQDFWALIDWIKERNQNDPKFKLKKIYISAAQGYLNSLDPHSSLVSREAWVHSTQTTKDSSFEGIGAILTTRGDFTLVESPLEGRPAHKAGLRAGDTILKVNGESIVTMPLPQVVRRIRGKKGTKVVLTIRREGYPKDFEIGIVRAHIAIKNVQSYTLKKHKKIGYIKVTGFVDTTDDSMMQAYRELERQTGGLRGLVLDLRNNSGGLLDQAVKLADRFIQQGIIVTIKNRRFDDQVRYASPENTLSVPLIVLVNDGSASASEILASAIQEHGRGLVIGDRTFGKASVQTLFPNDRYSPTYYIKLTISRYYAPSGRTLQVTGVIPDVMIPPKVGGKMPVGFREENLSNHLSQLGKKHYNSPNRDLVKKLQACVKKSGLAEKLHAADPNPQIKFDYQLMKGADYLECLIQQKKNQISQLKK
ncbi:MAG: S41 family peptidase [Myxococcales bacterium]|nr:S41 family peptidase [Myxococcales bacterium]